MLKPLDVDSRLLLVQVYLLKVKNVISFVYLYFYIFNIIIVIIIIIIIITIIFTL